MNVNPRVLTIADLHLDIWLAKGRDPFTSFDPDLLASLDALIIAGDLSNKPKVRWPKMLAHLARYVPAERIYLFPGNHDYYDHVLNGDDRLAAICEDAGANFAQKQVLQFGDCRYLCCTLWTDFALTGATEACMYQASQAMNDYHYIRWAAGGGFRKITPIDVLRTHTDHRAWLEARLAEPFAGRTIVMTHHAPLADCITDDSPVHAAYASDLSQLIETYQPDEWLFGHTHHHIAFQHGKTRLHNISLGYPWEVTATSEAEVLARLAGFG